MKWLCVDPGETTGWSVWEGTKLVTAGQTDMWNFIDAVEAAMSMQEARAEHPKWWEDAWSLPFGAFVVEDWVTYPWIAQAGQLNYDKMRTPRAIGALTHIARRYHIPMHLQGATIKNEARAAGAENMYIEPVHENRHANDSMQHGVFYLAINGQKPPC